MHIEVLCVYGDITHLPDPNNPHFFIQLLFDRGPRGKVSEMMKTHPKRQTDTPWFFKNADQFIKNIELLKTASHPGKLESMFYYLRDGSWPDEEKLPRAEYQVEVTDERWIQHFNEGDTWGTTCYQRAAPRTLKRAKLPKKWLPPGGSPWSLGGVHDDFRLHADAWKSHPAPSQEQLDALIGGLALLDQLRSGAAVKALGLLGENAAPAVPRLCQMLSPDERSRLIRIRAVVSLGRIGGARAAGSLTLALTVQDDYLFCMQVVVELARLGPVATIAVDALRRLSVFEDAGMRALAWLALHRIVGEKADWIRFVEALDEEAGMCIEYLLTQALSLLSADELVEVMPRLAPIIAVEDIDVREFIYFIAALGPEAPRVFQALEPHLTVGSDEASYLEETLTRVRL